MSLAGAAALHDPQKGSAEGGGVTVALQSQCSPRPGQAVSRAACKGMPRPQSEQPAFPAVTRDAVPGPLSMLAPTVSPFLCYNYRLINSHQAISDLHQRLCKTAEPEERRIRLYKDK